MSTYLREMNAQVWCMIDVNISHDLKDCTQIQTQKKYLYLKAHTSNALFSVFSVEITDEFEMKHG
jgi:hypothetical protein